ncbi:hypothetical protein M3Y99_01013400 [Aphelenchoides fujianensis]|nr:hypothetical protein M3Y99_01013400 [Aphelenchoides fujianensis]
MRVVLRQPSSFRLPPRPPVAAKRKPEPKETTPKRPKVQSTTPKPQAPVVAPIAAPVPPARPLLPPEALAVSASLDQLDDEELLRSVNRCMDQMFDDCERLAEEVGGLVAKLRAADHARQQAEQKAREFERKCADLERENAELKQRLQPE